MAVKQAACLVAALALVDQAASVEVASQGYIASLILGSLNARKDTIFNPAIANALPDPLKIDAGTSGKTKKSCIIPNPFDKKHCICDAGANYDIALKEVNGLKSLHLTNFTDISWGPDWHTIKVAADLAVGDIAVNNGKASASVDACSLKTDADGTVSTHISVPKAHVTISAAGHLHFWDHCVSMNVTESEVQLDNLSIHDTKVNLKLAGIDLGNIGGAINDLAKSLESEVKRAASVAISDALKKATADGSIPCFKIPVEQTGDVQIV